MPPDQGLAFGVLGVGRPRRSRLPIEHEIGVRPEFPADARMSQSAQPDSKPFAPCEAHRGNHVRVSGHEHNGVRKPLEGQCGNVESNPHVHAFLDKLRNEVPVRDSLLRILLECPVCGGTQTPTLKDHFPTPDGKMFRFLESLEQSRVVARGLGDREVLYLTSERPPLRAVIGIRAIEETLGRPSSREENQTGLVQAPLCRRPAGNACSLSRTVL